DLAEHAFDALIGALVLRDVVLQERLVAPRLDFRQVRNGVHLPQVTELTDFLRTQATFCRCGHDGLLRLAVNRQRMARGGTHLARTLCAAAECTSRTEE